MLCHLCELYIYQFQTIIAFRKLNGSEYKKAEYQNQ